VHNIDRLTYAGDLRTVASAAGSTNYRFEKMDILNKKGVTTCFRDFAPDAVLHLAAETHVELFQRMIPRNS
jgi:dTDP-glucose 4,6-dehydratase